MAINVEMPLHKARELMAPYRNAMPINMPLPEIDNEPPEAPNILVDAVSLGGPSDAKQKPLVRHVLVKDLNKIGTRLKFERPKTGVFRNKAPMGLYALFDGQSCAGESGPMAAEFCARNFHTKLLKRLSELPTENADEAAVHSAIAATFEDLDQELLANQPEVNDGCGAAVALLIGETVFTAVLGQCCAVLCSVEDASRHRALQLGGRLGVESDAMRIRYAGGGVYGDGSTTRIRHPMGGESLVSRSLGDRYWKDMQAGVIKAPLIISTPEVQSAGLKSADDNPYLLLCASTVSAALSPQEMVDIASDYQKQPRAACGEIATRALSARAGAAQCTALQVCFLPPRRPPGGEHKKRAPGTAGPEPPPAYPALKKAKVTTAPGGGTASMRLRHILLRVQDTPVPPKDGKKPSRTRQEAEAALRKALAELREDLKGQKKTPKDAVELVSVTSKKFTELCKSLSECETARKGGNMTGDLGWLSPEELTNMGGSFKEVVDVLLPGQFSDIAVTEQGLHLIQRVA